MHFEKTATCHTKRIQFKPQIEFLIEYVCTFCRCFVHFSSFSSSSFSFSAHINVYTYVIMYSIIRQELVFRRKFQFQFQCAFYVCKIMRARNHTYDNNSAWQHKRKQESKKERESERAIQSRSFINHIPPRTYKHEVQDIYNYSFAFDFGKSSSIESGAARIIISLSKIICSFVRSFAYRLSLFD